MLIKFGILIILLLGTIVFAGIKMADSLKQREIKMLFYSLYGMTIFTIFNIAVSIYFFIALKHKKGPAGPKGKKGALGDSGIPGICNEDSCLRKSLQEIIVNYIETKSTGKFNLNGQQRKMICSFTNNSKLKKDNIKTFITNTMKTEVYHKNILNAIKEDNSNFKEQLIALGNSIADTNIDIQPEEINDQFCKGIST